MKILIATPLYPPDIAPLARYVKELGARLRVHHEVTIVAYGAFPEKINGVRIVTIRKDAILPLRLFSFFKALWKESKHIDYLFIQNGASVELPVYFLSHITQKPIVIRLGDPVALKNSRRQLGPHLILSLLLSRTSQILLNDETDRTLISTQKTAMVVPTPELRPEILPFVPYPTAEFVTYEKSWEQHIANLLTIFNHAN